MLKSITMYGSDCWSLATRTESKIQAAEMRVLRTIKRVIRTDRITKTAIRAELKVEPLSDTIEKRSLQWHGYIMRMSDRRYPKKAFLWTPQGKRSVGRPRKRWIEGIQRAMVRRGTTLHDVNAEGRYDDRVGWRQFVRSSTTDR